MYSINNWLSLAMHIGIHASLPGGNCPPVYVAIKPGLLTTSRLAASETDIPLHIPGSYSEGL